MTHSPWTYNPWTYMLHNNTFKLMNAKEQIGKRIRELRNSQKISQEQLALKADIDRTYMTGVENGRRNVSIILIDKIIKALEISYEDFFKGYDNIK